MSLQKNNNIQIIIPMTGEGSRFKTGFKPFIEIHGKPMIEWVVKMFSGDEDRIVFICRQKHLNTLPYMEFTLKRIAPQACIYPIKDWEKKGPVNDILRASKVINDACPIIICYCDYYMHWDYEGFKAQALKRNCDGAVPCYSGFHPHLIPPQNLYASCKVDKEENLIEIREKFSWAKDKTKARHSPGIYYFKNANIMKTYFKQMIEARDSIRGEYYASLPFNYLVRDGLKVWCPINVEHFCQWGTPDDLEEYLFWMNTVKGLST